MCWYATLAVAAVLTIPGLLAVAGEGWDWTADVGVFFLVLLIGVDAAATGAVLIALWRDWIEPPDEDDDGDGDDDDDPADVPGAGSPWTGAHSFALLR